jgi:hypothetical protein
MHLKVQYCETEKNPKNPLVWAKKPKKPKKTQKTQKKPKNPLGWVFFIKNWVFSNPENISKYIKYWHHVKLLADIQNPGFS